MRLGIGTYTLAWNIAHGGLDHLGLMGEASDLGAEIVQFCENLSLDGLPDDRLAEVASRGLALEIGTRGLDSARIARHAHLARRVGSPFVRLVIDSVGDEPTPEEAVARLREPVAACAEVGVRLAIENHDRFPVRVLRDMVETLGPTAAVCLDTANSLGSLEGTREVVETLAPHTVCLHVKDVRARRLPHQMGFVVEGAVAGKGSLDVPWILRTLDAAGASYSVILEQWPPVTEGEPPLALEREMARESFAYLRSLHTAREEPGLDDSSIKSAH